MNSINRIAPVKPMTFAQARYFSTANTYTSSSDSDAEAEDDSSQRGSKRFFKFLEKAESLDKKLKENPAEAKLVGDQQIEKAEQDEEVQLMFDANEIEISFADQAAEKELDAAATEELDAAAAAAKAAAEMDPRVSAILRDQKQYELVQKAKKRFDLKFFQGLAYEGPLA